MTAGIEYGRLIFSRGKEAYAMPDSIAGPERSGERAAARLDFQVFPGKISRKFPKTSIRNGLIMIKNKRYVICQEPPNRRLYYAGIAGGKEVGKILLIDEKDSQGKPGSGSASGGGKPCIMAMGYRISEYYKITEQTKNILQVTNNGGTTVADKIRVLLTEEEVNDKRISEVAEQINMDYAGRHVHLICILKGGVFLPASWRNV